MTGPHARVHDHLASLELTHTVWVHDDLPRPISSPADMAAALGRPLGDITKTVLCQSKSGQYVAVVSPIDQRNDLASIGRLLDCGRLSVAGEDRLAEVTGYPRHGVSPLGLGPDVLVTVAAAVLDRDTVLVGGGAAGVEIEIAPTDLVRATGATIH